MPKKAEQTTAYILEKVAPVFNRKGYSATSLQDITSATGLTKGAIYGNFENKNELAIKAFVYNINLITNEEARFINAEKTAINKLYAISTFYKNYYEFTREFGGCPILNIGIDANHQNPVLVKKVQKAILNIQGFIINIIETGIANGEIKPEVDALFYARQIFSTIEGAIFMTMTTENEIYLKDATAYLDRMIEHELKL